jgi:anti-sigma B factor antagonist
MQDPGTVQLPVTEREAGVDEQAVGPDLVLSVDVEQTRAVVAVRGELDAYSAPRLEGEITKLLRDPIDEVVLDLSETGFLDSSGLRAILSAHRRLNESDRSLQLRAPSEPVTRLLEITGLTDHFTVEK